MPRKVVGQTADLERRSDTVNETTWMRPRKEQP